MNDVVVSNINLRAGSSLTVTYTSDVQPASGSVSFAVAFDGGSGPDPDTFLDVASLEVTVKEVGSRFRFGYALDQDPR